MVFKASLDQNQFGNTVYVSEQVNDPAQTPYSVLSDDAESQVGFLPGLIELDAESDLGEVYKSQWLMSVGCPCNPGGPTRIQEHSINDSSELISNSKVSTQETRLDDSDPPRRQQQIKWDIGQSLSDKIHMTGAEERLWHGRNFELNLSLEDETVVTLDKQLTGGKKSEQDEPNLVEFQIIKFGSSGSDFLQ
jgi:hypothetical protein